jgi:hypothetical protein
MINQFASVLMNMDYQNNPDEIVAPGYFARNLPSSLSIVHAMLFPPSSTRFYTQFLFYNYSRILSSVEQDDIIYALDPRITYDLNTDFSFFNIATSKVLTSPVNTSLRFTGIYIPAEGVETNIENFRIQKFNTNSITIQSTSTNEYMTLTGRTTTLTSSAVFPVTQDGNLNQSLPIPVGNTGIAVVIVGNLSYLFSSAFLFTFYLEAPLSFDINALYNSLFFSPYYSNLLLTNSSVDLSHEKKLLQSTSELERLSGIVRIVYKQINAL